MPPRPIRTIEEFHAHAIAIEREAAERYREFAAWFSDRGEEVLAGLCANIGRMEARHHDELVEAARHLALPALDADDYSWLGDSSPEAAGREVFYRVAQPRHLLEVALQGEVAALAFFRWVEATGPDEQVRSAAREMAQDEELHIRSVRNALEYHVATGHPDWDELIDSGTGPDTLAGGESAR